MPQPYDSLSATERLGGAKRCRCAVLAVAMTLAWSVSFAAEQKSSSESAQPTTSAKASPKTGEWRSEFHRDMANCATRSKYMRPVCEQSRKVPGVPAETTGTATVHAWELGLMTLETADAFALV